MRYFLFISYKGTHYHGWQVQENALTVQGVLNDSLSTLLRTPIKTMGSGRTDTGVHATMQVAHFDFFGEVLSEELIRRLNGILPKDISVSEIKQVKNESSTRFDAISRQYHYKIHTHKNPFLENLSYQFHGEFDLKVMNKACEMLLEWSDFECFSRVKTEVNNFNCNILEAIWNRQNDYLLFSVRANRFLRGMVRAIVGTMLEVGQHKMDLVNFQSVLESRDRKRAGRAVPPSGLYLNDIVYPKEIFINR